MDTKAVNLAVVSRYLDEIWNEGRVELIAETTANPLIRHSPGEVIEMSHESQMERIKKRIMENRPHFSVDYAVVANEAVAIAWNGRHADGSETGGIEIFKIVRGTITEVWNNGRLPGLWK